MMMFSNLSSNNIPVLLGCFGLQHIPALKAVIKPIFFDNDTNFFVSKSGHSQHLQWICAQNKLLIVDGMIYSPAHVSFANVIDKHSHSILFDSSPISIKGNFVLIKYRQATDSKKAKLEIVVDKFGTRPLFYCTKNNCLFFSTHSIWLHFLLNRSFMFDPDSVLHYYHFGVTANNRTLFKDIYKLPPGSVLKAEPDKEPIVDNYFNLSSYWQPGPYENMHEYEIAIEINKRLKSALSKRLRNVSKVGIAISGGIDSGVIAAKLSKLSVDVVGFNLSYANFYSELDRIALLTEQYSIPVHRIVLEPRDVYINAKKANQFASEPISFNQAILMSVLGRAQAEGISLLFDGDGTDRLFFGMSRHLQIYKAYRWFLFFKRVRILPLAIAAIKLIRTHEYIKLGILMRNWSNGFHPYGERIFEKKIKYNSLWEKMIYDIGVKNIEESYSRAISQDDLRLFFEFQAVHMCPQMFFHAASELQGSFGIMPISPFFDDDLVKLSFSIPMALKTKKDMNKYILRKAASFVLPGDYWRLPKIGLQNSYRYYLSSPSGREWYKDISNIIEQSQFYSIIKGYHPDGYVDIDRLVGLQFWHELNKNYVLPHGK